EVIDSAAALPAGSPATVLIPSGDGCLYCLDTQDGREIWRFDARVSPRMSYNNWFEANVTLGPDGTIYAGNTNFNYYALTPDGRLKWTYETGSNAWSAAALGADGRLFWGSCDTCFHAVSPDGRRLWRKRTLGFVSASAAVGRDGTVYIGSFDSYFYALDPASGKTRWKVKTGDHIYGSAALLEDEAATRAIFIGSTDGTLYALGPHGERLWQYDTGAPIRSSPVVGRAPDGAPGHVVYFGSGNGRLYALDAASGARRWSYDTTAAGAASPDRNDLNGSPALGRSGIYIGGEHGQLWYLPYDYPLHHPDDPRGCTDPAADLPRDVTSLYYVTPGGRVQPEMPASLPAATLICLKLIVRENGHTQPARFDNNPFFRRPAALHIAFDPPVPFHAELSGDGRYVYVIPDGFLAPGTRYTLTVRGAYVRGGLPIGNLTIGGRTAGQFSRRFAFDVETPETDRLPLPQTADAVAAFEWTRLAVPIPPMLPSLNQIGFDYMHWLIAPVAVTPPDAAGAGRAVLWAVGARRNAAGELVVDTETDFRLPLSGRFQHDAFILTHRDFKMAITGIPIPFNRFQIRGRLGADLRVRPGASAYAETQVLRIPTFGIPMVIAGLANQVWRKLLALATYVTHPYPADGAAARRPAGVAVAALDYQPPGARKPGLLTAQIRVAPGHAYPADAHLAAILLVDAAHTAVVPLDYHRHLRQTADAAGSLRQVTLTLPPGTRLPPETAVYVILDAFPLFKSSLSHDLNKNA
ncbi:MAG: PQQ-binding-like beta-propeller repeat protein, partial [Anaerolineales bacterium]|nr:PQQ-binding-like beta-propeller repeat protein [Anaerolineales bacterium]